MKYQNEIMVAVLACAATYGLTHVLDGLASDAEAGEFAMIAGAPAVVALGNGVQGNAAAIEQLRLAAARIEANQRAIVANQDRIFNAITQQNN